MRRPDDDIEDARIADNLRRAVELTDLCLALRCAVLAPQYSRHEAMKQVMREIRLSRERAWRRSPS